MNQNGRLVKSDDDDIHTEIQTTWELQPLKLTVLRHSHMQIVQ